MKEAMFILSICFILANFDGYANFATGFIDFCVQFSKGFIDFCAKFLTGNL